MIKSLEGKAIIVAEHKRKVQIVAGGPMVDGVDVPVDESNEKWSEYTLQDGTVLRLKQVLTEVVRTEGYDSEGNPVYVIKAQPVLSIVAVADNLKRKTS